MCCYIAMVLLVAFILFTLATTIVVSLLSVDNKRTRDPNVLDNDMLNDALS